MPLLLTRQDVESLLTMRAAIMVMEVVSRELALGNTIMPQRTVFKSVGLAVQDVAMAVHVYNLARRHGVGSIVNL